MRGLKPFVQLVQRYLFESHLLQMRGLKLFENPIGSKLYVASFTDAWIETDQTQYTHLKRVVASFTDAWIETVLRKEYTKEEYSRIFYRCVD